MKEIEEPMVLGGAKATKIDVDKAVLKKIEAAEGSPGRPIAIWEVGEYSPDLMDSVREASRIARRENKRLQAWLQRHRPDLTAVMDHPNLKERMYVGEKRVGNMAYVALYHYPEGRPVKNR